MVGDVVQYFVVAQDLASDPERRHQLRHVPTPPASVAPADRAAFPIGGTIRSYNIVGAPLTGDYTVGPRSSTR